MEQNFEKLEELIKDDDKIVTITFFACEVHIPIAESKEIFKKYVEINKGSKEITITYILNGKRKGEDRLSLTLIKNENLKEEKELYEEGMNPVIFSIQKAKNIDFNAIALVDSVGSRAEKVPIAGAIIGKNCIKRVLRKKLLPILPTATVKGKSTIFTKQNAIFKSENPKVEKSDGDSSQNNKKGNTQSNIASLFSKAAQNKKPEQKDVTQPEKKQKTNGGLSNFLTKQSSKEMQNDKVKKDREIRSELKAPEVNRSEKNKDNCLNIKKEDEDIFNDDTDDEILKDLEIKDETQNTPDKTSRKEKKQAKPKQSMKQEKNVSLFDSDTDDDILKDLEIKNENSSEKKSQKKKEEAKKKKKSSQKKKRGMNDVGNDKLVKKRKRIIVEDESDSDDIFGSEKSENEDVIEKSDEEPEPVQVEKKHLPPKNKRRKAVEKIYEDEEGYIVTKTEYVYETPSEDENEPENKIPKIEEKPKLKIEKKAGSNSENDISPNKGTKSKKGANKKAPSGNQPTLMNFFKKK